MRRLADPGRELRVALSDPDPAVRRAALTHPECPDDLRRRLCRDPDRHVAAWAVERIGTWSRLPEEIWRDPRWEVRMAVCLRGDCPDDVRRELMLSDRCEPVRVAAARHFVDPGPQVVRCALFSTTPRVAAVAAQRWPIFAAGQHGDPATIAREEIRAIVAARADAPAQLLSRLGLQDRAARVRAAAVANPAFPRASLPGVVRDRDPSVRCAALQHAGLDVSQVRILAHDHDLVVRLAALADRRCPPASVAAAVHHPVQRIRIAAVRNPRCPTQALEAGLRHGDAETRYAALSQVHRIRSAAIFECLQKSLAVAKSLGVPEDVLSMQHREITALAVEALAQRAAHEWPRVAALRLGHLPRNHLAVIARGNLPRAAGDRRLCLRLVAATDPHTPHGVLLQLSADRHAAVRLAVAGRDSCPDPVWEALAGDPDLRVQAAVAANPDAGEGPLLRLLDRGPLQVRLAIAERASGLSAEVLRRLAADPDRDVRATASRRLLELIAM